jgi:murein DD-endopeptidase MepM/ murein hydrolase activator NlpD
MKIKMLFPLARINITSTYGMRGGKLHGGYDFAAKVGDKVYAIADSKVIKVGYDNLSGNFVTLFHPATNDYSCYAHLYKAYVSKGQAIKRGKVIGSTGHSGHTIPDGAGGTHLHFEMGKQRTYYGYVDKGSYFNSFVKYDFIPVSVWLKAKAKITPKKAK